MKTLALNLSMTIQKTSLEKKIKLKKQKVIDKMKEIEEDIDLVSMKRINFY